MITLKLIRFFYYLNADVQHIRKSPQKPAGSSCPPIKEPVMNLLKSPSKKTASPAKLSAEESGVLCRLRLFEAGKVGLAESPSRPQNQAVAERQREMKMLSNRWNRNKELSNDDEPVTPKSKPQVPPMKAAHNVVSLFVFCIS